MNRVIKWVRQIPSCFVIVIIFWGLYLTGLHTEVIGVA